MKITLLLILLASFAYGQNPDVGYLNERFQKRLELLSQKLKIPSLSDSVLSPGKTEIRLTVYRAWLFPKVFIIKSNGKQNTAVLISANDNNTDKQKPVYKRRTFKKPKRGWKGFQAYLKEQGVSSNLELSLDKKVGIDPDSGFIILEAKSDSNYQMVWYPFSSESADKKKVLNICQRIGEDFSIKLYCQFTK